MIGDLVLSSDHPAGPGRPVGVPSVGDVSPLFPSGAGRKIVDVRQKVAIISDDLVVAWAGSQVVAMQVLPELEALARQTPLNFEALDEFLATIDSTAGKLPFCLVGFLRHSGGLHAFGHNAAPFDVPTFGKGFIAGVGADAIGRNLAIERPRATEGTPSSEAEAAAKAMAVSGFLLQLEIANHRSLLDYYGGGYELATMTREGFRKLEDITYAFFHARLSQNQFEMSEGPDLLMKIAYDRGDLMVRTLRPRRVGTKRMLEDSLHCISQVHRKARTELPPIELWPSIESRFFCRYVFAQYDQEPPEILCKVSYQPDPRAFFQHHRAPGVEQLRFPADFFSEIGRMVQNRFGQRSTWKIMLPGAEIQNGKGNS